MLRNFHYIDEKGKDQGINGELSELGRQLTSVRNRANEIAALLSDVDKIRTERRKARANRSKYQGVEGGMFNTATGSRYGGFGSDSFGRGGGGGGSGFGGSSSGGFGGDEYRGGSSSGYGGRSGGFRESEGRKSYDEYEGADNFDDGPPRRTSSARTNNTSSSRSNSTQPPKPVPKEEPKKEVNLFDFDDEPAAPAAAPAAPAAAAPAIDAFGDDDFDDFQSAASPAPAASSSTSPAPAPAPAASANANLFALLDANKPQQAAAPSPAFNMGGMASALPSASTPSYASPPITSPTLSSGSGKVGMGGMGMAGKASATSSASKPASKGSAFDDLWTSSLGAPSKPTTEKKTIGQMEKEHATSGLWGASKPAQPQQPQQSQAQKQAAAASDFDDLLL